MTCRIPILKLLFAALGLCVLGVLPARGLTPGEVVVLYNGKSAGSVAVANFYAKARKIPQDHVIPIVCTLAEEISEEEYRTRIVPQVRQALAERKLEGTVKCLVTAYDMPLKIGAWQPTFPQRQEINAYKERLNEALEEMDRAVGGYEAVAPAGATSAPATGRGSPLPDGRGSDGHGAAASGPATASGPAGKLTFAEEIKKLNAAGGAAAQRVEKLPAAQQQGALAELIKVHERVAGIAGLLAGLHVRADAPDAAAGRAEIERLQGQLREVETEAQGLGKERSTAASRKRLVSLRKLSGGLIGEASEIQQVLDFLEPVETESCFDNELALVLAEQDYPRGRWVTNPMNVAVYPSTSRWPKVPRTILVSRVDGLTAAQTEGMIETGLKVEKNGLDGKIYLDARGLKEGPYSVFDEHLRAAAAWLRSNSTMPVVLDDTPALLEAKNCPDCALYCGWYSVRHYQDSCQWLPGAVGYHVASFEMVTLHDPAEMGWVPNLLKRGFCGTLGPTAEPYLASFPNPAYFFPLLMCGEFTQGEVWEVTAPMLSWRTAYVGDPLYNPFKAHPRVTVEAIKADTVLRNAFTILRPRVTTGSATAPRAK